MITTNSSPKDHVNSEPSWSLAPLVAKIDSSISSTTIPKSLYTFVIEFVLKSSIGYYYDKTLKTYVMSCNQTPVMPNIYVFLKKTEGATEGIWYVILASDYLH